MKTYEDFLQFLKSHIREFSRFVPVGDEDFHSFMYALCRFLLSEPYRFQTLLPDWPQIAIPEKPSDDALLGFFKEHKGLPRSFAKELKAGDLTTLRQAYAILFPICVQKDDFTSAIFRKESKSRKYKAIVAAFPSRFGRLQKRFAGLKKDPNFLRVIEAFTKDLTGFSLTLIQNRNLLDQAVAEVAGD
jgi:hypothetical protein